MNTVEQHLKLRLYPDPILEKICRPIECFDTELSDLTEEMKNLLSEIEGQGLSAPQVGFNKRLIIFKIDDQFINIINPKLTTRYGSEAVSETCVSLPDIRSLVLRSKDVLLTGYDLKGNRIKLPLSGTPAKTVQHEVDHLDGQLIFNYW